jgi:foldase protein PrsA
MFAVVCAAASVVGCQPKAADSTGEKPGVIRSQGNGAATPSSAVIASVDGALVTDVQLAKSLRASYGLDTLLKLVQLEFANQLAAQAKQTVTPDDIEKERQITMRQAFPGQDSADFDQMMDQYLAQQRITREEFDTVMRTNAALRAAVRPAVKSMITEEDERRLFGAKYGEKVRVRHIALSNPQEVAEAKRRLAAGEAFEQVAREMSRSPRTARLGGELPPFTRNTDIGKTFVETAFALQIGEVSDAVQQDKFFHLIKLEQRIEPTAVKFEDYRDSMRTELEELNGTAELIKLRQQIAKRTLEALQISDAELKKEFEQRKAEAEAVQQRSLEKDKVLQQLPTTNRATPATSPIQRLEDAAAAYKANQASQQADSAAPAPRAAATTQAAN